MPSSSPALTTRLARALAEHRVAAGSLVLLCSGVLTAFAMSSAEPLERKALPEAPLVKLAEPAPQPVLRATEVRRGDTVPVLMQALGISDEGLRAFLISDSEASRIVRRLRPGMMLESSTDPDGQLAWLKLRTPGSETGLRIARTEADQFALEDYTLDIERREQFAQGTINSSLFAATDAQGLPDSLALEMADIFASQIDFNTDLRQGDHFTLIFDSLYHRGEMLKADKIKALEFVNDGERHTAFWFDEGNGRGGYYDAQGQSLRRSFLRSPLEFTRISSGFTRNRMHPIAKVWRAHKGTDFAAPTGTRVRASSDGRVEFVGVQRGYGNFVLIKHAGGYTTAYGHLNGFAKGLKKGQSVNQGEVIGFVGSTGWATGPHLHYEFRKNGTHFDPMRVKLPGKPPLKGERLQAFLAQNAQLIARLDEAKAVQVVQRSQ